MDELFLSKNAIIVASVSSTIFPQYLSFIFSQSMIVFGPLATIFIPQKKYYQFSDIISKKSNVEYLICEIENKSKADEAD